MEAGGGGSGGAVGTDNPSVGNDSDGESAIGVPLIWVRANLGSSRSSLVGEDPSGGGGTIGASHI
jgi:hypothetical protein